ncbi:bleomycin resistance family protein [Alkalihalobacillus trypoxylicola]|uniref:Bleomycin resistance protein n=1 Tax=Alkalihalobacillus trypoxylicola TaxID=519424 RepID=A0A162ENK1_9BACI|nr:bleomycin resistance family protein [Alkalihalobacillus trypoxylicola]KYG33346.1 hypothetical protein AZF04_16665 [Alkalihalobacillus trypoxylicola]
MKMIAAIPRFPVSLIQESILFYHKMGFEIVYSDSEYAILSMDKVEIHLFKWSETEGISKLVAQSCRIHVKKVEQFYEKYKDMNIIHPNGVLTRQNWGELDFTIIDLDNNAINFFQ